MSAVSVLVMDWTTTGASPPTITPPTSTPTDFLRGSGAVRKAVMCGHVLDGRFALRWPRGGGLSMVGGFGAGGGTVIRMSHSQSQMELDERAQRPFSET